MRLLSLALLAALVVAGLSVSTQYVAGELRHDPALGPPWVAVGETRLYPPWAWVGWSDRYAQERPTVFRNASAISTLAALLGVAAVAVASAQRRRTGASVAHGSSRWATTREVGQAGLLCDEGVVLCQTDEAEFKTTVGRD